VAHQDGLAGGEEARRHRDTVAREYNPAGPLP
jgi:hypothetical protein